MARTPDAELYDDLDAFVPKPIARIRFKGKMYAVRAFLDLPVTYALQVLRAEIDGATGSLEERQQLLRTQISLLAPELPAELRQQLTVRQATQLAAMAKQASKVPATEEQTRSIRLGFRFAVASRFYGWAWSEIGVMTVRQLYRYLDLIPEIRARENLENALVYSYPYLGERTGRKIYRMWLDEANLPFKMGEADQRIAWNQVRAFVGAPPKPGDGRT